MADGAVGVAVPRRRQGTWMGIMYCLHAAPLILTHPICPPTTHPPNCLPKTNLAVSLPIAHLPDCLPATHLPVCLPPTPAHFSSPRTVNVCSTTAGTSMSTATLQGMVALPPLAEPTPGITPFGHVDALLHLLKPASKRSGLNSRGTNGRCCGTGVDKTMHFWSIVLAHNEHRMVSFDGTEGMSASS